MTLRPPRAPAFVVLATLLATACGGGGTSGPAAAGAPGLASLAPTSGASAGGTAITLSGSGFAAGATVTFGGAAAVATGGTATTLTVTAPQHAPGPVDVVVHNPDGQSSTLALGYTFVAPPSLTSVEPGQVATAGGTAVLLHGSGFLAGATVLVGGAATPASLVSASQLVVSAPPHAAGTVDVVVRNADGQQSILAGALAYSDAPPPPPPPGPPSLSSLSPATGPDTGGTSVGVSGANFAAGVTVLFDGVAASVSQVTATTLTALTPPHADGPVTVTVQNPDGQSASLAAAFTYQVPPPPPAPVLSGVAPATGLTTGGDAVVLSGSAFAAGATVTFGGVAATVVSTNGTTLDVKTPPHAAGGVAVAVRNPDGQTATLPAAYTYQAPVVGLPAPVLASVTPAHGPAGQATTVTLSGSGFLTGMTVTFGGVAGTVIGLVFDGSATVATPPGAAGAVDVMVHNPDGQASNLLAGAFTFDAPAPTITALNRHGSPPAGGTIVLILGANLEPTAGVAFDGVAATGVSYDPVNHWVQATTPPHADGFVPVTVTLADGQTASIAGFHYGPPPVVQGFTPTIGKRGDTVTVTGTGFADLLGVTVRFGGTTATITSKSPTQLVVTVPKLNPGPYPIVVANFDDQFSVSSQQFTAQ
jgi:hypothetical protein